jgi:hypothetical protein
VPRAPKRKNSRRLKFLLFIFCLLDLPTKEIGQIGLTPIHGGPRRAGVESAQLRAAICLEGLPAVKFASLYNTSSFPLPDQ